MQDDGFVAKLLVEAGAKDIAVGTPLAVLVEEADQVGAFADYSPSASGSDAGPSTSGADTAPGWHPEIC